jgi:hypothetical protein
MNPQDIFKAVRNLAAGAEITFNETDLDSLVWYSPDIKQPTKAAILEEIERIIADEPLEAEREQAKKLSAQAKLEALGLTADDLRALGL